MPSCASTRASGSRTDRALVARLDAQHRGVDARVATSSASLEVQGPGDAAAARLEMRARGFLSTNAGGPAGDEEILFFCRTRRERGELVRRRVG